MNAESGRQRLEAILDSSPDPVLFTDQQDHLIMVNPLLANPGPGH